MDWGKWFDGLWKNGFAAIVPVLIAALETIRDNPTAGFIYGTLAALIIVGLQRLANWVKNKDKEPAT